MQATTCGRDIMDVVEQSFNLKMEINILPCFLLNYSSCLCPITPLYSTTNINTGILIHAGCLDKESGNCKKNKEMWMDDHCTKRICKSKVLRNGEAKSKIDIKEASTYLTICNSFNLPHF